MNKGRICHISSVHYRFDTRILHRECSSLVEAGYEVYFLVLNQQSEEYKEIKIRSIDAPISNRLHRMVKSPGILFQAAFDLDADLYHFHDPELLRLGRRLQKAGKKVIYDVHEHVPKQIRTKKYLPVWLRNPIALLFEKFEDQMVAKMDGVVTATDVVRDRFLPLNSNTVAVNNYPKKNLFHPPEADTVKKYDVSYVGLINEIRGIRQMADSLKAGGNWKLHLIGNFSSPELEAEILGHEMAHRIHFMGRKNREELAEILAASRLGIVTFLPAPNHNNNQPNKLFEYMAAGLPVVCSHFDRWKAIVDQTNCGQTVDPENPEAIGRVIQDLLADPELLEQMSKDSRQGMEQHYNWATEEAQLLLLYQDLLTS